MTEERIYLGRSAEWGAVYLSKHSFDCGWYWGFGYLGNRNCHFHINSMIDHPEAYLPDWTDVSHHFESTWLTQGDWWILRDLFITAYALKDAAAAYRNGGHQSEKAEPYRVKSETMEKKINDDLKIVLDNIWTFLEKRKKEVKA